MTTTQTATTAAPAASLRDYLPIHHGAAEHRHRLIRRVLGVRGEMRFRVEVYPRFNYARDSHETVFHYNGVLFTSPSLTLALETAVPLDFHADGAYGEFTLLPGQTATFVLEAGPEKHFPPPYPEEEKP